MKLFVWDFHGVLEKGNEKATIEISNLALEKLGYIERFSFDDVEKLYGLKWYQYFQALLPHESVERCMEISDVCFDTGLNNLDIIGKHIRPNDYAHEVIDKIAEQHHQIVISNTSPDSILMFLESVGMREKFSDDCAIAVDAHSPDQRKSKAEMLEAYLEDEDFDDIVVIGDSPKDVALTSVAGGTSYLYTHPWRDFNECESDYKIHDLREVLREV
ncbi:MAG: HAD hydrolase-like protein [Candidatus Uhrbacteria bacterium]|nr:HAD hydrolase-like protein [Candidatus Uhrbacteria bacterium]